MRDYKAQAQKHIHDLKKSAGLYGNGSARYEYVRTREELEEFYLNRLDDLGYPLRVEPKRDRIVLNEEGFKKAYYDVISSLMDEASTEINRWINQDVNRTIEENLLYLLNSVKWDGKSFSASKQQNPANTEAGKLGAYFGKKLAESIDYIWKDMTGTGKKRK